MESQRGVGSKGGTGAAIDSSSEKKGPNLKGEAGPRV